MEVTLPSGTIERHSLICCRRLCRATTAVTSLASDNLANVTLDDNKPTHTIIAESSGPVIAAAIIRGPAGGRNDHTNARHIQNDGKNYQANNLTFPISPQIREFVARYGNPTPTWITTATVESAQIRVGFRQDGRYDFQITRLHWGVRT